MAKNKIQFQKGLSLIEFNQRYSKETQCWQVLFRHKYPKGFICVRCNYTQYYKITRGQGLQCKHCGKQHSLRTGTMMQHTKLPFRLWFIAIYFISQSKKSISSLALKRHLGVSYDTAWLLHQKIMHALKQADDQHLLQGIIQVDDGYLGGKRSGARGRGAKGKQPFMTALSYKNGKPDQLKLSVVKSFSHKDVAKWRDKNVSPFSSIFSDALPAFTALKNKTIHHISINISQHPHERDNTFMMINTIMGNLKRYLLGMHHAIRAHRLGRYLFTFAWRFNHRYNLEHAFNDALLMVFNQPSYKRSDFQAELY